MQYISLSDQQIFYSLQEPDNRLFLLQLYGKPLETFLNTWTTNFGENEAFLSSYLFETIKTFVHCFNLANKYNISPAEREKAIKICSHNVYFIWQLFGVAFEETADDSALLFGDMMSIIYCFNKEQNASVLRAEYESVAAAGDSPSAIEIRCIFLFLESLLHNLVNKSDTITN